MTSMRGQVVSVRCLECHDHFIARVADRKRGWAQFCSKRCKAVRQTRMTGRGKPRHAEYEQIDPTAMIDGSRVP